jgi:hypothetical protein
MVARRCLGLVLLLAAALGPVGCQHKKGCKTSECHPCCTPVIIDSCGCGCGGGIPAMPVSGHHHHHGGGGCGCNDY